MRTVYDVSAINIPRTIAGVEWKPVVGVAMFFGMAALMFKVPLILIAPVMIILFLRVPGSRDPDFLKVYRRHSQQRDVYSPAYVCKPNLRFPRPNGFGRMLTA